MTPWWATARRRHPADGRDPGLPRPRGPGRHGGARVLPGFSDSHWFRRAFPDCIAYGFFPQKEMDIFEAVPLVHGADERVPVADLGLAATFYSDLAQEVLR